MLYSTSPCMYSLVPRPLHVAPSFLSLAVQLSTAGDEKLGGACKCNVVSVSATSLEMRMPVTLMTVSFPPPIRHGRMSPSSS